MQCCEDNQRLMSLYLYQTEEGAAMQEKKTKVGIDRLKVYHPRLLVCFNILFNKRLV